MGACVQNRSGYGRCWVEGSYRVPVFLIRELDVDERGEGADRPRVLCVIDEVLVARLELRIPFEEVEA